MSRNRPPRMYRVLMRLFPRPFRREFGDDMARLYLERREEAGASRLARTRVWLHGVRDLLSHALAERWGEGFGHPRSSFLERRFADVRTAVRGFVSAPGFAAAAIGTLALGIGANVAIFTAVNSLLLQPLPLHEPERLVRVWPAANFNITMVDRVTGAMPAIEAAAGVSGWLFTLTGEGDPQRLSGAVVSANYFDLLGVQPALGRTFAPEEGMVGQADVVVLSHGVWTDVFGADPGVLGRRIRLAAGQYQTREVIGVMPASFGALDPNHRLWTPLDVDPSLSLRDDSSWFVNTVVGRLAGGATIDQATAQARSVAASLHKEWPERFTADHARGADVVELQADIVGDVRATLWTLLGAVSVILLIACVNVANLTLARGTSRHRDLAMRAALGATRGRLSAQLLTESVVLALAGGVAGLLIAWLCLRLLIADAPEAFHRVNEVAIDPVVMGFALCVSMSAVLLFGLLPARWASRAAHTGLAGSARGVAGRGARRHLTGALVVAEVALSVVLVIGASLMLRSLWELYADDVGLDPEGVLTLQVNIPEGRFEREELVAHYREIWDSVGAVPGVEQAGGIHLLPLTLNNWSFPYEAEDHPVPEGTPREYANHRVVTPSYFGTLDIPLLRGRGFDERDTVGAPAVGMINRRMATELWPDDDPIGKSITVFGSSFTVIGVVGDVRQHGLHHEVQPEMYRPFDQWPTGGMFMVLRASRDPASLTPLVRQAVWQVDPDAPIAQVRTMAEVFGDSVADDRFVTLLLAASGGLALVLGSVGVYGVTSHSIGQRVPEYGVRMAIGASRPAVLRQAIGQGFHPALLGVVIGIAGAWWASRLLGNLLYRVDPADTAAFLAAPAVLLIAAAAASWIPAWRASRLDPVVVLRHD